MHKFILYSMLILINTACHSRKSSTEKITDRVQNAVAEKEQKITSLLKLYKLKKDSLNVLFVAYKDNDQLDLYAKNSAEASYRKIDSFAICKRSGKLGPKKAEGDKQVPEGFYHIDRFNPQSLFHLSLGINYPNELDKSLGRTGSDIFIHGKCETVGCLPMTDALIKEIYLYAAWAKDAGQVNIPVYIFPFAMTDENRQQNKAHVDAETLLFWKNLQEGYQLFNTNNKELLFNVAAHSYNYKK